MYLVFMRVATLLELTYYMRVVPLTGSAKNAHKSAMMLPTKVMDEAVSLMLNFLRRRPTTTKRK